MRINNLICIAFLAGQSVLAADQSKNGAYQATAYAVSGITASGEWTHRHVVAADPAVLPIGSRIKVKRAGRYSGEYVVADTGAKIIGRKLDIYMPDKEECVKFGTRRIRVRVIQIGDGTQAATKQADQTVKKDVAKDIAKGAVGQRCHGSGLEGQGRQDSEGCGSRNNACPRPAMKNQASTASCPKIWTIARIAYK